MEHIYVFSNRRRAKDSVLAASEIIGNKPLQVMVKDEMVYACITQDMEADDVSMLMHYGVLVQVSWQELLVDQKATEIYRHDGIRRFRV